MGSAEDDDFDQALGINAAIERRVGHVEEIFRVRETKEMTGGRGA